MAKPPEDRSERESSAGERPPRRHDDNGPDGGQSLPLWATVDVGSTVPPVAADQGPNPEHPPKPDFAGMAVSAALSMARFAASGFRRVDAPTHAARSEQCARCRHLDGTRCRLCGCFADVKAWLPHEDCPVGRWPM